MDIYTEDKDYTDLKKIQLILDFGYMISYLIRRVNGNSYQEIMKIKNRILFLLDIERYHFSYNFY